MQVFRSAHGQIRGVIRSEKDQNTVAAYFRFQCKIHACIPQYKHDAFDVAQPSELVGLSLCNAQPCAPRYRACNQRRSWPDAVMKVFKSSFATIVAVNTKLLMGSVFCFVGWAIWPTNGLDWWQYRIFSALIGMAGVSALIGAVKIMIKQYKRETTLAEFDAMGAKPKSSRLTSLNDMNRSGMRDG